MPLSQRPELAWLTAVLGTAGTGISIIFMLDPSKAVAYFDLKEPTTFLEQQTTYAFVTLYAVRNIYMAGAIYAALYYKHRSLLGLLCILCGVVAFLDGIVARKYAGKGEWNHWRTIPVFAGLGSAAMGLLD